MITSSHLKTALMAYYRFKKQNICADEVKIGGGLADVLVDTGLKTIEIEVKISKADLRNDKKKVKHEAYRKGFHKYYTVPNFFILCIPTELVEEAKIFVKEVNTKYGIIEFSNEKYNKISRYDRKWDEMLYLIKKPELLTTERISAEKKIIKRLCSSNINFHIDLLKRMNEENINE